MKFMSHRRHLKLPLGGNLIQMAQNYDFSEFINIKLTQRAFTKLKSRNYNCCCLKLPELNLPGKDSDHLII